MGSTVIFFIYYILFSFSSSSPSWVLFNIYHFHHQHTCFVNSGSYTLCHSPIFWLLSHGSLFLWQRGRCHFRGGHMECALVHTPILMLILSTISHDISGDFHCTYTVRRLDYKHTLPSCSFSLRCPSARSAQDSAILTLAHSIW